MLRLNFQLLLYVITGLAFCTSFTRGQDALSELNSEQLQAIVKEAYGYGLPIVENYRQMHANAIDTNNELFKAPFNELTHDDPDLILATPLAITPNLDVVRSYVWADLRAEPLVLKVPRIESDRYYSVQLVDLYTFNFAYLGSRTKGNTSGNYLLAGPNWQGTTPDGIDGVIQSETEFAFATYRTQLRGLADLNRVKQIQSQFSVVPLSEFLNQPAPEAQPIAFPPPAVLPPKTDSFFNTLNFLLKFCAAHPTEVELMNRFAKIGVGRQSNGTALSTEFMQRSIEEADDAISAAVATMKSAEVYGSRVYLDNNFLKRAVASKTGLYGNSREEALSSLYLTDGEGKSLDANQSNYVLHLANGDVPPVKAFWSVTVYDGKDQRLVENPIQRFQFNSEMTSQLKRNADGGATLFLQREAPSDENASNWLPTPDGPFYLILRLYWPIPDAYEGKWTAPLVWPAETAASLPAVKPAGAEATEEVKPPVVSEIAKPEMERPTVWGEPTEVKVSIYMIDVDEVNSADQSFAASVYYEARWKNPLLRHRGPGPKHRGLTEVWNPRLTIIGQQMAWKSFPESVEIGPDGTVVYRQKDWPRLLAR